MPTIADLTGLDLTIKTTVRGGQTRLNLLRANAPVDLAGVATFNGKVIADKDASLIGGGVSLAWPVVDAPNGGITIVIPSGLPVGDQWYYVSAAVAGSTVEICGTIHVDDF